MKYPQLVSMPSAVQDWLDEQLEARGIDAVVYTRYILSLLQRDTLDLPDDLLTVSSNKVKEVGRRGRKRGRYREEYWDVCDCEQLKRSAAVECLMSASDQKCGIEKLVDELCAKLKEIQSEGEKSIHSELPQETVPSKESHTPSPQDQVQKYYAAFPPLNGKVVDSSSFITLIPEPSSAWSGKKVLSSSFGKNKPCYTSDQEASSSEEKLLVGTAGWGEENKENRGKNNSSWKEVGRENMKSGNQIKEKTKGKKETFYGFAWNMASERNGNYTDFCPGVSCENSSSDMLRIFHCNRQNKGNKVDDNVLPGKELRTHREAGSENAVCRRLYERQTGEGNSNSSGCSDPKEEKLQISCVARCDGARHNKSPGQGTEDQKLAQLIAKFDHSIEALWNPDDISSSPGNFSSEETLNCDQELPLDFQQLLSSPNEQYLTVELYNLNSKRNQNMFSTSNTFIQCGTNITSSIWSDQPSQENSVEQDLGMDYAQCEQQNASDHFEDSKIIPADSCCNDVEVVENKYAVLVVGEGKVVGNKCHSEEQLKGITCKEKISSGSLFKDMDVLEIGRCYDVPTSEDRSKVDWNDNFSSLFTSLPWTVNYTVSDITQGVGTGKWSSVVSSSTHGSYSPFGGIFANGHMNNSIGSHLNIYTNVLSDSLTTLNHNREDSSFTEVIPKQNSLRRLLADRFDSDTVQEKKKCISAEHAYHLETKDSGAGKGGKSEAEREEEDLLTSTRTHFRPIHTENMELHHGTNASNNNNVGGYADGTTFVIPTNLEEVTFKRSESGTLYLEAEAGAGLETPNRYMEYKEKEVYGGRYRYDEHPPGIHDNSREFIPKFRVRQNEKWCQTEEAEDMLQSDEEVDTKRSRQDVEAVNDAEDFYFPDDDHFAEKILNSLEDGCEDATGMENKNSAQCHPQTDIYVSHNSSLLKHSSCLQRENKIFSSLGPDSLNGVVRRRLNNSRCLCGSNSHHLQLWKTGWPKSSQVPESTVWESAGSDKPQSWYSIWNSSPGSSANLCQCDMSPPVSVLVPQPLSDKEADTGGTDVRSLQYSRLREELTVEGEQLLSDLSYMQHLYQGSDWQDDTAPAEESMPDWRPEQEEADSDRKLCYLSPPEDTTQEMMMYAEDAGCTHSLPSHHSIVKERKSVDDFGTFPRTAVLSTDLEEERMQNERPLNAKAIQKDRKRRHSASQRACSYYLEGSCRRPHCRFSHDLATVPCRFWADSSCLKGIACPFLHGSAQALRPVTL